MVFVHGGSSISGTGCDYSTSSGGMALGYGSSIVLAESGVVSVTLNYRLSVFGFLYMEESSGKPLFKDSANTGLRDVIEALRWTRNNIAAFGGDRDRITVYGQSSGGTVILGLLASPLAKGLFHRAYSASGSASIWNTKIEGSESWRRHLVPNLHGCEKDDDASLVKCLQNYPADKLFSAQTATAIDPPWILSLILSRTTPPVVYLEIVDGEVVVGNISAIVAEDRDDLPIVPTIISATREESDLVWNPNTMWPMTQESTDAWAKNFGDGSFANRIWNLFHPTADVPARQRWGQLTSGIRMVCPNLLIAQQMASTPRRSRLAPVYSALVTYSPSNSFRCFGIPINIGMKYAFHMWDIPFLLFNRSAGLSQRQRAWSTAPLEYSFSPQDQTAADRYRAEILEFAAQGSISTWSPMEASPANMTLCEIGDTTTCTEKSETLNQCKALWENGLSPLFCAMN